MKTVTHYPFKIRAAIAFCFYIVLLIPVQSAASYGQENKIEARVIAHDSYGIPHQLGHVKSNYDVKVTGSIIRTKLTQIFSNDENVWLEGSYLFPLPHSAAVDRLKMFIGDRVIEGKIHKKEIALKKYEKAKKEGKNAALVEQDRPNIFRSAVAHIPPNSEITIQIEFQHKVEWADSGFSFRQPTTITPRYSDIKSVTETKLSIRDGWQVLPGERSNVVSTTNDKPKNDLAIKVKLAPGYPLKSINSYSHNIIKTVNNDGSAEIVIAPHDARADRDFIIGWKPDLIDLPRAAFFSEASQFGTYGMLDIVPPKMGVVSNQKREVIFVIDTSGSMSGRSIKAAKRALLSGLNGLKESEKFNIIGFDDEIEKAFSTYSVTAKPYFKSLARSFVDNLVADGGTNMLPALTESLSKNKQDSFLTQVIFITDGAVSNEKSLFRFIRDNLGHSRLFTVAIGSAPNSHFMEETAIAGRGTYTYIADDSEAESKMKKLFSKIELPALTDIKITGQGLTDIVPKQVPDLYSGETLSIAMAVNDPKSKLFIEGRVGDELWKSELDIRHTSSDQGVATNWARSMITSLERHNYTGLSQERTKEKVTELGLAFHQVTPYTSLVAVDVTPIRTDNNKSVKSDIPLDKPNGLSISLAQTSTGYFKSLMFGLFLAIASILALAFDSRKKAVNAANTKNTFGG